MTDRVELGSRRRRLSGTALDLPATPGVSGGWVCLGVVAAFWSLADLRGGFWALGVVLALLGLDDAGAEAALS